MTIQEAMKMAVDVQNASNLSGVLHSWANCQSAIREDKRYLYRRHPVNVLFMSKIASLLEVKANAIGCVEDSDGNDMFFSAYNACANEGKVT